MHASSLGKSTLKVLSATALVLTVPFIAMQFTREVSWTVGDFVAAGVLLFGAGMAYVLVARRVAGARQRVAVGSVIMLALLVLWAELAVGIFS